MKKKVFPLYLGFYFNFFFLQKKLERKISHEMIKLCVFYMQTGNKLVLLFISPPLTFYLDYFLFRIH